MIFLHPSVICNNHIEMFNILYHLKEMNHRTCLYQVDGTQMEDIIEADKIYLNAFNLVYFLLVDF